MTEILQPKSDSARVTRSTVALGTSGLATAGFEMRLSTYCTRAESDCETNVSAEGGGRRPIWMTPALQVGSGPG